MKRLLYVNGILVALCLSLLGARPLEQAAVDKHQVTKAANEVLKRVVGKHADQFRFEVVPFSGTNDAFEVEASGGKVTVRGNCAIALTRGAYHYLRSATHSQVTWSGSNLHLPKRLPDFPKTTVTSPYQYRLYYNVCAFGYTTAFWGWKEWEKELDWMALHGINMPLAMVGQEAIWQRVWNSYGLTNNELSGYFTGPAFLPWHRMGNINKHDGPLPQGWLDQSRELQKKIVRRMKELGMQPVVPAFSGFVPPTLDRHHSGVVVQKLASWADFDKSCQTQILSADSPLYSEIGKKFIEEYRKEYGQFHFYLSDSFNEMEVPVTESGRYRELAQYGEAVYKSITAGDPNGVWVMQGWLFYNAAKFWDRLSVQALLSNIPDNRMMIIDLAEELWQGWKAHDGFYGKHWIYSVIHNFGGNNPMNGALKFFAEDPSKAISASNKGALVGMGISPEGIENNEVIYELLTDVEWEQNAIDLDRWLEEYCTSRYGSCPEAMKKSWQLLVKSIYTKPEGNVRFGFQKKPSLAPRGEVKGGPEFEEALRLFLSCANQLRESQLYQNDLIELVVQYTGVTVDSLLRKAGECYRQSKFSLQDSMATHSLGLMKRMDDLLASRNDRRLERWVDYARQWGKTDKEKNYYEMDAKRQVTVWGGPVLSEYAAKVWSGLIRDYYAQRWRLYYQALKEFAKPDVSEWQEQWITTPGNLSRQTPVRDVVAGASALKNDVDGIRKTFFSLK